MTATTTPPAALSITPFLTPLVEGTVRVADLVSEPAKLNSLTITPAADPQPFLKRHRLIVALVGSTPLAALTAHEYFADNAAHIFIDKVDTSGHGTHRGLARALVMAYLQSTAAALASTTWFLHVYAKSAPTYLLPTAAPEGKRVLNDTQLTQWWQSAVDAALWGHPLERFTFHPGSSAGAARKRSAWVSGFPVSLYAPEANPQAVVLDLPDHELARLAKADTAKGVETLSELLQVWQGLVEAKGGDERPACLTVHVSPKIGNDELSNADTFEVKPVAGEKVDEVVKTLLAHKWGVAEQQGAADKAWDEALQSSGATAVEVAGSRVRKDAAKVEEASLVKPVHALNATLIKKKRTAAHPASPNKKAKVE